MGPRANAKAAVGMDEQTVTLSFSGTQTVAVIRKLTPAPNAEPHPPQGQGGGSGTLVRFPHHPLTAWL